MLDMLLICINTHNMKILTNNKNRTRVVVSLVAILSALTSTAAVAEGQWTSSFTNFGLGSATRSWVDGNTDAVTTSYAVSGCTYFYTNLNSFSVRLLRERTLMPDVDMGVRTYNSCSSSQTNLWADEPKASYHFSIVEFNSSSAITYGLVSASKVVAKY